MKIFFPLVIFLIAKTNVADPQQRLLLRKLQNFEQNNSTTTWNDIVANVLVNNGDNSQRGAKDNNFWTKYVSQIILLYKVHIYDKIKNTNDKTTDSSTNPDVSTPDPKDTTSEKPNDSKSSEDPKAEVELFEPNYHGKMQETTEEVNRIPESKSEGIECPEGYVKNDKEQCTDSKSSKFILGIPNQCPTGYRRDRLGFCRIVF